MRLSLKKDGYVTDKKELQIILEDINDLLESSESDSFTDFLSDVKLFIITKHCCSIKQKQSIEDALVRRKIRSDWDSDWDSDQDSLSGDWGDIF